jgi:hypothetical protein
MADVKIFTKSRNTKQQKCKVRHKAEMALYSEEETNSTGLYYMYSTTTTTTSNSSNITCTVYIL